MQSGGDEILILKGQKNDRNQFIRKKIHGCYYDFLEDTTEIDNLIKIYTSPRDSK